ISETKYGPMVHAKLGIAEENSGKLVAMVKQKAQEIAEAKGKAWLIVDGPPGIGCPVIAALARVDLALIVTEPTLSGIHDMERVMDLAAHFGVTAKVVINKCDINWNNTQAIEEICQKREIEVIGRLPFSEEVVRSLILGIPVVEFSQGEIAEEMTALWRKIEAIFQEEGVALGDKKEERL
ncbi:MAG TPA: (4Fe-4S)-binding protein, partial [Candidatus Atribacteria bacterium]|nr:(4Fe-4S)-binding protein [Candidatus Atribacteria bacterium]